MAAALLRKEAGDSLRVDSAGVYEGGLDPFAQGVMAEVGIKIDAHQPKQLRVASAEKFDLVVALTPEAAAEAHRLLPDKRIEFWPIDNPSIEQGGREAVVSAYRRAREQIRARLAKRFPEIFEKP